MFKKVTFTAKIKDLVREQIVSVGRKGLLLSIIFALISSILFGYIWIFTKTKKESELIFSHLKSDLTNGDIFSAKRASIVFQNAGICESISIINSETGRNLVRTNSSDNYATLPFRILRTKTLNGNNVVRVTLVYDIMPFAFPFLIMLVSGLLLSSFLKGRLASFIDTIAKDILNIGNEHRSQSNFMTKEAFSAHLSVLRNREEIRRRKDLEAKVDLLEQKKALIDQFRHDIKSPLSVLKYLSQETSEESDGTRDLLLNAVKRFESITSSLNEDENYRSLISTNEISRLTFRIVQEKKAVHTNIEIHFKFSSMHTEPTTQSRLLYIHQSNIERVISNIIENAIEASTRNPRFVMVNINSKYELLEISVANIGKKIPIKIANRIFDKGFSTKTQISQPQNQGLGLYHAKRIIQQHKGKIFVNNTKDGVESKIHLPYYSSVDGKKVFANPTDNKSIVKIEV